MDKSWMKIRNKASPSYMKGIDNFLEWACSQPGVNNRIRCPCKRCRNVIFKLRDEIRFHLASNGFLDTYEVWEYHGENLIRSSPLNENKDQVQDNDVEEDETTATAAIRQEILMDKSWMKIQNRASPTYIKGIDNFLEWACSQPGVNNRIRCPCKRCRNVIYKVRNEVRSHLLKNGFLDTYEVWEYHGENLIRSSSPLNESNDQVQDNDVKEDEINAIIQQEMLMDKSWMKIHNRADPTYIKGIDSFLDWACSQPGVNNRIRCPCNGCRNVIFKMRNEIRFHLLKNGFLDTYQVWEYHGENLIRSSSSVSESNDLVKGNYVEEDDTTATIQQKKLMDKSWMKIRNRADPAYIKGIDNFLEWAYSQPGVDNMIRCPCKRCANTSFNLRNEIRFHLLKHGFRDSYKVWDLHGENLVRSSSPLNGSNDLVQDNDVEKEDIATTIQQEILMDTSWIEIRNRGDPTYIKGIDNFLKWACSQQGVNNRIRCPCKKCGNVIFNLRNEIRFHLLKNGFLDTYKVWDLHGENLIRSSSSLHESNDQVQDNDGEKDGITATIQQGQSRIVGSATGASSTNLPRKKRRI